MYCAAPLGSCEKGLGVLDAWGIGERSGVRPSTGWKAPARGTTRSACSFRLQWSPSLYTATTLATRRGPHISPRSLVAARPRVEIRVSRRSLGLSSGSEALLGEAADRFERADAIDDRLYPQGRTGIRARGPMRSRLSRSSLIALRSRSSRAREYA